MKKKNETQQLSGKKQKSFHHKKKNSAPPIYATQTLDSEAFLAAAVAESLLFFFFSLVTHLYQCEKDEKARRLPNESWVSRCEKALFRHRGKISAKAVMLALTSKNSQGFVSEKEIQYGRKGRALAHFRQDEAVKSTVNQIN